MNLKEAKNEMSRIKLLLNVIKDIRALGDSLQTLADAAASDEPKETSDMKSGKEKSILKIEETKLTEERPFTLEDVRAVLADKSRQGHTAEIRTLLQKYGANKLSEISPENYPALLAEAKVIGNAG